MTFFRPIRPISRRRLSALLTAMALITAGTALTPPTIATAAAQAPAEAGTTAGSGADTTADTDGNATGMPGDRDVIVHLFEWSWDSVATECTTVLGPAGFGAVQVSPPQEHVVLPGRNYPWWQDYQPVSYTLASRRGDRADFASMVIACHNAGVKIYVDAILNHMAGGASTGPGSGGSTYSQYAYPSVPYGNTDFHHCGRNGNDDIRSWTDRWEVQNCELVDLSDLATESTHVRSELVGYLNDLVSLGVDGFRIDAAKHLPAADLQAIVAQVNGNPYVYQEVIEGGPGEVSPIEYTGIGDVTEFRYGDTVGNAFRNAALAGLSNLAGSMLLSGDDAVAFIDNHDTQRNNRAALTYKSGTSYALAEAFMLAWPYGVPQVMSSFTFTNSDTGPPTRPDGTTTATTCGNGWECEHRLRTTRNLVDFHNTVNGTGVTDWWSNGNDQIAFGRGTAGYVAFNRSGGSLTRTFDSTLPGGTYCDIANGDVSGGSCTGQTYVVAADGTFTATVAANSMLALHIGARVGGGGSTCTSVQVSFAVDAATYWGQNVYVVGNRPELANWNPQAGVALSAATYPIWRGSAMLPSSTTFEYKYVKRDGSSVVWESGTNRTAATSDDCTLTLSGNWRG